MAIDLKNDFVSAAPRAGARQIVRLIKAPILGFVQGKLISAKPTAAEKKIYDKVERFLESELGAGAVGFTVGCMLPFVKEIPLANLGEGKVGAAINTISRELRVEGLAKGQDYVASVITGPVFQGIRGVVMALVATSDSATTPELSNTSASGVLGTSSSNKSTVDNNISVKAK
jgi:hypothetical protein